MSEPRAPLLLWLRHAPHSTVHLSEALRLAAMASALGTPVRLLFLSDGVRALVRAQEAYRLSPPIARTLLGVVTAESPALVHAPSLARRRLGREELVEGLAVELVDDDGAADWLLRAGRVVPF